MKCSKYIIFLSVFIFTASTAVQAQQGSISGVVIDKETRETIIGVTVKIEGTTFGAATDFDGRYIIRNVNAGTYTLVFSYIGYNTFTLTNVEVHPGERLILDVILEEGATELDAISVVAFRETNSIEAVILEVQKSTQVVSGVSSQQISRTQDSNAAQVMQRVPGITIVESRFVMIRGLSERYNNVMINNAMAPSTEVDKRTFSFDLISSGSLDRMMIYKSGSADLPGDFAGGVIKLYTIDNVETSFTKIDIGVGYRAGTTGRDYYQSRGSNTDFLGFDSGYRTLPSAFPDTRTLQNSARNAQLRIDAAHSLPNNFLPTRDVALGDQSVGITIGRNFQGAKRDFSNITTINYSTGYQYYERDFFRYFEWEDRSQPILKRFEFRDDTYQKDNKLSVMTNWKVRLNSRNFISFKNLFNQIGENETIIRNGVDFIQRPDDQLRNYLLGYRSRTIYTGQLEGVHDLDELNNIRWVLGGSLLRESEPDMRRFRTFRSNTEPEANFSMQMPPSSNLFDTGRYYGNMTEYSINQGLDFTSLELLPSFVSKFKTGYMIDYRNRDFSSRYLSYLYPGFFDPTVREDLIRLPLDEIFSTENVRTEDGFVIEEGTRPLDSYLASSFTASAYVNTEIPLNRMLIIAGLRTEYNIQTLDTQDDFENINIKNPILSILPFLNATYSFSDKTQLRMAYGRTVNRPEFRELAPFVFYDYKLDAGRFGNPNLKHATIDNVDLRLELYPRVGETISIGGFFKYFDNPIENKTTVTTESPQFGYINADFAFSYGVELELRKSLQGVTNSAFLDRFSINANGSLIFTEVDLGDIAVAQDKIRSLQGQSPYMVNAALYYDDQKNGFGTNVVYNIIGPRIFSVGDVLFPTIYEMPRNSIDLTVSKKLSSQSILKLGITDLLNAPYRFYEDSDRNNKIDENRDNPIFTYKKGQLINFTFSYRF